MRAAITNMLSPAAMTANSCQRAMLVLLKPFECDAPGEVTGGYGYGHLPVRRRRPIRDVAGLQLCCGRITERLALAPPCNCRAHYGKLSGCGGSCEKVWGVKMSTFRPFRRQVSIDRDGEDFVITFRPLNIRAIRHHEAAELRKICHHLRWEVVSDTVPDPEDIRTW